MPPESEGERLFTVEEANAALERLRISLDRIREARQVVLRSGERVRESAAGDGGGREGEAYWNALRTLRVEMEGLAADGIVGFLERRLTAPGAPGTPGADARPQ